MAKRKSAIARSASASAAKPVVVRPAIVRVGGGRSRAPALASRAARAATIAAIEERHTLTALAAAGIAGWLRRSDAGRDLIERLPALEPLGPEGTAAIVAWAIGRWGRSRVAEHIATGLGSVAIYRIARGEE